MHYAEVVFNIPLNHKYTYKIPEEIKSIEPGSRVLAPFGRRILTGVVVNTVQESSFSSPKNIIDVLDEKPLISAEMLSLTQWISEYYLCSWGQALQLALPKGIEEEEKEIIHLLNLEEAEKLTEKQRELYLLIGSNSGNSKDYYRKQFGQGTFYSILNALEKKGLISREKQTRAARVKELYRKFVAIPEDYEVKKQDYPDYLKYLKKRPEIDEYMRLHAGRNLPMAQFLKDTSMATPTLQKMHSYQLCNLYNQHVERRPQFSYAEEIKHLILTAEQKYVIKQIMDYFEKGLYATFLLHGVTGSGKTQVYIEILKEVIKDKKTALILIPEIALTPQTVGRFETNFPGQIAVFHSKMSAGERYDAWMACYHGQVKIVVGPRSALFVPLKNMGLIVIDEEHETTYKQTDVPPRYHARDVAVYWARMNQALVILGSATPSLESYYNSRKNKYQLLEIRNRVDNQCLPEVSIIDLKTGRGKVADTSSLFSDLLIEKMNERIGKGEQIILLQNRRGYSSFLQCHECGYIPLCPNCDVTLTYHSFNEKLLCHYCGHNQAGFDTCPNCGGSQIAYKGVGTQRIQNELKSLYPRVRILRMDQDTTRVKNSHDSILNLFGRGEADILLGTQMIAKGLDFANVTLVGVISADVGLAQPDFRAPERVFQLLTQVAGRSGRGQQPGEVIVQSYIFSHFAIQFAKDHDYLGFYMHEMQHRQNYNYPPLIKIIQIVVVADKMSDAINSARSLAITMKRKAQSYCQVIGPAPAVIPRLKKRYRWQLILKLNNTTDPVGSRLKSILSQTIESYSRHKNRGIRIIVDVDPLLLN